ncbi:MAG: hypothetical protein WCO68_04600 [Verrucomicrobiota bacterium]
MIFRNQLISEWGEKTAPGPSVQRRGFRAVWGAQKAVLRRMIQQHALIQDQRKVGDAFREGLLLLTAVHPSLYRCQFATPKMIIQRQPSVLFCFLQRLGVIFFSFPDFATMQAMP